MAAGHSIFSHAEQAPALSGQTTNPATHALRNASLKMAGVILLLSLVLLILLSAKADSKRANDIFGAADASTQSDASSDTAGTTSAQTQSSSVSGTSLNVSTSTTDGSTSSSVTVNGEPVAVPDNGTVSHTYTSPDGSTTTVNVSNSNSGSNDSSSSTYLNVSSNNFNSESNFSNTTQFGTGGSN